MCCGSEVKSRDTFVEQAAVFSGAKTIIVFDEGCACEQHAGDGPNPSVTVADAIAPVAGLGIECRHLPAAVRVNAGIF